MTTFTTDPHNVLDNKRTDKCSLLTDIKFEMTQEMTTSTTNTHNALDNNRTGKVSLKTHKMF